MQFDDLLLSTNFVTTDQGVAVQGVYTNAYVKINESIKPSTAAIYANQMNMFNMGVDLAAQRLVLSTTNASIAAQRIA